MNFRTLPATDLCVAPICLGSSAIGSTIDAAESFRLLDLYVEQGGNFIDTAAVYANWLSGETSISEKTIGRWLQARGNREKIVLATKGAHPELATMHIARLSHAEIEADLNASLRNLQTDVIDLYWLHRDDPARPVAEILESMNALVQAGKIRYFGCSNWRASRIAEAQAVAAAHGMAGFAADQMRWSLAVTDPAGFADRTTVTMDDDLFACHRRSGMAALAYSAQAGGLFQKLARGEQHSTNSYPEGPNRRRLARIRRLGAESGLTITQIVLGFLLAQPFVTVPIVGCRTVEQLCDSLAAAATPLTEAQIQSLVGA